MVGIGWWIFLMVVLVWCMFMYNLMLLFECFGMYIMGDIYEYGFLMCLMMFRLSSLFSLLVSLLCKLYGICFIGWIIGLIFGLIGIFSWNDFSFFIFLKYWGYLLNIEWLFVLMVLLMLCMICRIFNCRVVLWLSRVCFFLLMIMNFIFGIMVWLYFMVVVNMLVIFRGFWFL